MHSYAQHSPVFLAFNKTVLKNSGGTLGTFCVRCHTPVGISSGESSIAANDKRSEAALDSVGCVSCHSTNQPNQEASSVYHVPVPGYPEPIIYGPYYGSDEPGAPSDPSLRLIKSPHVSRHTDYITSGACAEIVTMFFLRMASVSRRHSANGAMVLMRAPGNRLPELPHGADSGKTLHAGSTGRGLYRRSRRGSGRAQTPSLEPSVHRA
jgi:hypothetical protein